VINFGYPWWLVAAVVVVFGALLWYALSGRARPSLVVPLVILLAPVCMLAAVVVAMALSLALTEPLEPPSPVRTEGTNLRSTPERTGPGTARSARPASPTASPSPSATPSATPAASPTARTPR
jgi:hypothetical protein